MTQTATKVKDNKPVCPHCNTDHPVRENKDEGDPVGSGSTLGRRLKRKKNLLHYTIELTSKVGKKYRAGSLQAHHLVLASTCNDDEKIAETVRKYGYDINHKKNGELLPGFMDLACFLRKPVHNTNHDGGEAVKDSTNEYLKYSFVVKQKAIKIINRYSKSKICQYDDGLIQELNMLSSDIRDNILNFVWTISEDGRDYAPGNPVGCGGALSLEEKRAVKGTHCDCNRNHVIDKIKKYIESLN
jgi:hypothetical protein